MPYACWCFQLYYLERCEHIVTETLASIHLAANRRTLDSKVHEANMGPTWVLSSPGGFHVGPMNLAIWDVKISQYLETARLGVKPVLFSIVTGT